MDERSFDMCRRLFPEPPRVVGGYFLRDGEDGWDGLGSDEAELLCDEKKRGLCDEYGPDAVLCPGCDCGGDDFEDEDFGSPSEAALKGGAAMAKDLIDRLVPAMERMLGVPPEKVIFSGPATIAFWPSGDKVVAKCSGDDEYDREKGLMVCLLKKTYGSKAVDILGRWLED